MADTKPSNPDEKPPVDETENPENNDFVSKADYDKLQSTHNYTSTQYRKLKGEVETLKTQLAEVTKANPADGTKGNQALEIAQREAADFKKKWEDTEAARKKDLIRSRYEREVGSKLADGVLDFVFEKDASKFELAEDSGTTKLVLKDEPWKSIEDYIKELPPSVLKPKGAPGNGLPKQGEKPEGDAVMPRDFESWSYDAKVKFFKENPQAGKGMRFKI